MPKIPMVTEKSQANNSSALLESEPLVAIAYYRGEKYQYSCFTILRRDLEENATRSRTARKISDRKSAKSEIMIG